VNIILLYKSSHAFSEALTFRRRYKQLCIGMKQHLHHSVPTPNIDTSNLKKNEVIRFRYDRNGNLIEVTKEDRQEGCLAWVLVIVAAVLVYMLW
jgi:YD repeat-containing protein